MKDDFSITGWKKHCLPKLLKEADSTIYYSESDPESVQEAFIKAGIDMNKPVYVLEVIAKREIETPYKVNPRKLVEKLQQLKDSMENEKPGVGFDYDLSKVYKPKDYDLEGTTGRLAVMVGTKAEYVIFQ